MAKAYEAIDTLSEAQIDQLLALYSGEWWTADRRRDEVVRMLAATNVIVAIVESDSEQLVAFARALTDTVYKALILDVIVAPHLRSKGMGGMLMDTLLEHPALAEVEHFELYCRPDMIAFYERWGFSGALEGLRFMRRG